MLVWCCCYSRSPATGAVHTLNLKENPFIIIMVLLMYNKYYGCVLHLFLWDHLLYTVARFFGVSQSLLISFHLLVFIYTQGFYVLF